MSNHDSEADGARDANSAASRAAAHDPEDLAAPVATTGLDPETAELTNMDPEAVKEAD